MKKIFFVLLGVGVVFAFILYMNQSLSAYTQRNSNLLIEYDLASVEGRTYRAECLVRCDLPLKIKYGGTLAPEKYILTSNDLNKSFTFLQGDISNFHKIGIEYLTTENYIVIIDDWGTCAGETLFNQTTGKNETVQSSCIVGNHSENRTRTIWKEFDESLTIKKGEYVYLNFYSEKKASLNGFSVDIIPSLRISNLKINLTEFAWWNSSWTRKKEINITDGSGSTISNYSVRLNITYDNDMQADFDDLRFLDNSETVERDYWIEQKSNSNWAIVWVESGITANANRTIFMYYGNAGATSNSHIGNTFVLGDDFNDNVIDDSKWTVIQSGTGNVTENAGTINQTFTTEGPQKADVYSDVQYSVNYSIIQRSWINGTAGGHVGVYGTAWSRCDGEAERPCGVTPSAGSQFMRYSTGSDNKKHNNDPGQSWETRTMTYGQFVTFEMARIDNQSMSRMDFSNFDYASATFYNTSNEYGVLLAENGMGWMSTDWVAIRHFVFPEPTYVIGNEQMFSNSCSCPSINTNWNVALNEYCIINTACEIGSGNITFTGSGNFTCNANINASNLDDPGSNNIIYIKSACKMNLG